MKFLKPTEESTSSWIAAIAATVAANISHDEMTLVASFAVIGAAIGGLMGAMLGHVLTGPGLDKLTVLKRWLVNWCGGIGCGFFGAWHIQKNFVPDYPVELVAAGVAFLGGLASVALLCLALPALKSAWRRTVNSKYANSEKPNTPAA